MKVVKTKKLPPTNCKLHCGGRGVSYAGFSQHRSVSDRNELRNPPRQHVPSVSAKQLNQQQPGKIQLFTSCQLQLAIAASHETREKQNAFVDINCN